MKKLTLGIIIGITLSLSTLTFASGAIKLIMVPEYVGNYKTVDLLQYMANLKTIEDKKIEEVTPIFPPVTQPLKVEKPSNSNKEVDPVIPFNKLSGIHSA